MFVFLCLCSYGRVPVFVFLCSCSCVRVPVFVFLCSCSCVRVPVFVFLCSCFNIIFSFKQATSRLRGQALRHIPLSNKGKAWRSQHKGGGLFKMIFQIKTQFNTCEFSCFEADDAITNLHVALERFRSEVSGPYQHNRVEYESLKEVGANFKDIAHSIPHVTSGWMPSTEWKECFQSIGTWIRTLGLWTVTGATIRYEFYCHVQCSESPSMEAGTYKPSKT
ncbi:hypothetical protein EMCRGX_G027655 [Ephydatia muelleri]